MSAKECEEHSILNVTRNADANHRGLCIRCGKKFEGSPVDPNESFISDYWIPVEKVGGKQ